MASLETLYWLTTISTGTLLFTAALVFVLCRSLAPPTMRFLAALAVVCWCIGIALTFFIARL